MQRIQVLPDILASQVAAGEVVERPASVVKELVENSLDAGARRVEVLVRRGGISLLRVVDDGHGMSREDALMCLERHATSKLKTKEDLAAIRTLGFRGEALPSIASVSKFTLHTREAQALSGTKISVDGGGVLGVEDSGEAPGTQVEVRNLFFNLPARRKFLRAEATEFSHIEHHLRVQALAHPEVSFSLSHDDRLVFHLPGGSSLLDRIRSLAGLDFAERLLEVVETERSGIRVHGFIGQPGLVRSNRGWCLTFLNGRPVESPVFAGAFRAAYGEALPRGQHPVAFLFVEISPAEVDVNVHPAKREVRFRDGIGVQAGLAEILTAALRQGNQAGGARPAGRQQPVSPEVAGTVTPAQVPDKPSPQPVPPRAAWQPPVRQLDLLPAAEQNALPHDWHEFSEPSRQPPPPATAPVTPAAAKGNPYRILGILAGEYVVMEGEEGLVLMDFRAAWERVLYEEARQRSGTEPAASQQLLVPVTLHLSPREFDFIRSHLPVLARLGVHAEEFGPNTLKVEALPAGFPDTANPEAFLTELFEELRQVGEKPALRRLDVEAVAAGVSRQAARLRLPGDPAELDRLVSRLLACEMPYCCPAGKATLIQLSLSELARKFGKRA